MKNTTGSEESIFRKKGFFIALISCLGAVSVLALIITFTGRDQDPSQDMAIYQQEAVIVAADQVDSYLAAADEEAWFRPRQQPTPAPTPPPTEQPQQTPPPAPTPEPPAVAPETPETDADTDADTEADTEATEATEETFTAFTTDDSLLWPVYGDIVMDFNMTGFIFDPTLDQFRTNDHVRISAQEGDPVRAAASGQVVTIGREARRGHYITIDHGNGFLTTYGQLMDTPMVSEGEIVQSGQVIGGVARQTKFASLDGTHVHLRVTHNDQPVNPTDWLMTRVN